MKKYYVLCLALSLLVTVWAVNAKDYLIGAYSQYQIRYTGYNYEEKFDSLAVYLKNAGYNATTYGSPFNSSDAGDKLPTITNIMHLSNISSMYYDTCWEPEIGEGFVGVGTLSYGNQLIIEAEYELKSDEGNFVVDSLRTESEIDMECLEYLDYVTKHNVGRHKSNFGSYLFSNNYAWECNAADGDSAGYAMSFPCKRWKRSYDSWPALLGKDLVFMSRALDQNELYMSVAIKHDNIPAGEDIASIFLQLYKPSSKNFDEELLYHMSDPELETSGQYETIPLIPCFATSDSATIKNSVYPGVRKDGYENDVFVFRADLSKLNLDDYMSGSASSYARCFYHINPQIYWHGNGRLMIDYIKIEDEYGRSIDSDPESIYLSKLRNNVIAINNMDTNNNILYLMSMDEPRAGQMAAYKNIQNYLDREEPGVKMITTSNLRDWDLLKEANNVTDTIYSHPRRFLYETRPNRVLVDIYPLQGTVEWNNVTNRRSAQKRIDRMVHYFYYHLAKDVDEYNLTQIKQ